MLLRLRRQTKIKNQKSKVKDENQNSKIENQDEGKNGTTTVETYLDSYPEKETTSTDAVFKFSSNIEGATFQCQINNQNWQPCESPKKFVNLTAGDYVFKVYAVDPKGKYDKTPEKWEWEIIKVKNQNSKSESNSKSEILNSKQTPNNKSQFSKQNQDENSATTTESVATTTESAVQEATSSRETTTTATSTSTSTSTQ